jgi:hypothetical protein
LGSNNYFTAKHHISQPYRADSFMEMEKSKPYAQTSTYTPYTRQTP